MTQEDEVEGIGPFLRELGRFQLQGYHDLSDADVQIKEGTGAGQSVVTEYDVESERRVARFLQERFPQESFLGEELGNVRRDRSRYWVLDPIDGTTNFTQGIAYWGPTLARVVDGRIVAGWIYFPVLDELFHATREGGAFLNGRAIRSAAVSDYGELATVATTSLFHRSFRLDVPAKHRILGSLIANLAYLAKGTFSAVYGRGRIWDLAAGVLIARESGALVECDPEIETLDVAAMTPQDAPRITVHGRAHPSLPPLQRHVSRNLGGT
ncbi:MAG: inositol monophosphatase [Planctomycetes bacterium]|nr:inositol monophosphatase [Planctomycetota bacterium]